MEMDGLGLRHDAEEIPMNEMTLFEPATTVALAEHAEAIRVLGRQTAACNRPLMTSTLDVFPLCMLL